MAHPFLVILFIAVVVTAFVAVISTAPGLMLALIFIVVGAATALVVRGHNGLVALAIMEILGFLSGLLPAITTWSAGVFGHL
jgi:hypothetical protein